MFIQPMLLEKADTPFNDDQYIVEWKQDGWRMLVSKWNGRLKLYSRHRNEFTSVFKEFQDIEIPDNTIIDCELIAIDESGKCNFELLQNQYRAKHRTAPLQLVVFDILFNEGKDVRREPLMERKRILEAVIQPSDKVVISQYVDGLDAEQYFELIKQHDLEGIVMKEKNSKYESKRSKKWLKVINLQKENVTISGIRKKEFGVYVSYLDGKYAGMIEFMTKEDRLRVYRLIQDHKVSEDDNKVILDNQSVIEVAFRNKYSSGKLRIPKLSKWVS